MAYELILFSNRHVSLYFFFSHFFGFNIFIDKVILCYYCGFAKYLLLCGHYQCERSRKLLEGTSTIWWSSYDIRMKIISFLKYYIVSEIDIKEHWKDSFFFLFFFFSNSKTYHNVPTNDFCLVCLVYTSVCTFTFRVF